MSPADGNFALHDEMVHLPGGVFMMGSNDHYPEERPAQGTRGRVRH
ncbi:MAG TPA: hypothetical protein VD865_15650 [Stenotrophomonas sp.]|nr:hypothetical protein [Stenotrophomonas sp.]